MQISVHNKTLDLSTPQVMGILNVTPDSVYAGSRKQTEQEIAERTNQIILEGGKIIDVGAFSTGPGSADVSEEEELLRMRNGLAIVRREQPDALVSIDTFRPSVARMAVEEFGADIINDISEGRGYYNNTSNENAKVDVDANENEPSDILLEVARLQVPYILMSLQADLENTVSVFLKKIKVLNSSLRTHSICHFSFASQESAWFGDYLILLPMKPSTARQFSTPSPSNEVPTSSECMMSVPP